MSISKTQHLKSFRICTSKKTGEGGTLSVIAAHHSQFLAAYIHMRLTRLAAFEPARE
jgi:hypothetical protein